MEPTPQEVCAWTYVQLASDGTRRLGSFRFLAFRFVHAFCQGERRRAAATLWLAAWLGLLAIRRPLCRLLGLILSLLRGSGRHDAIVVFRVLEIIFGHDAIAAGIGIAGKLEILLVNMAGRAADFDFRAGGIVGAVGIEPAAAITTTTTTAAVTTMLRPAAASA